METAIPSTTPVPTTTPPAEMPQIPVPPKSNKKLLFILLGLFIILLAIGGAFAFSKFYLKLKLPFQPTQPSPTPVLPTLTPDPTASWKTYTSKNFSFKYPNDWTVTEGQDYVVVVKDPDMRAAVGACPGYSFAVSSFKTNENYSIYSPVRKTILFEKTIDFSDKTDSYGCRSVAYFLDKFPTETTKPEWIIKLTFKENNRKEMFDQILSTFRFLYQEISEALKTEIISAFNQYNSKETSLNLENIVISSIKNFYDDIYIISYGLTGDPGGMIALVGKRNGKWIVGEGETYCKWIKESNADEYTKAYMGPTCVD